MFNSFKGGVPTLVGKKRRDLNNIKDHNLIPKDYYQHHLNVNKLTDSVSKMFLNEQKPDDTKPDDIADDLTKRMANLWKRKVVQKMKTDPVKFSTRIRKQTKFFDPSADDKVKRNQSQTTSRKSKSITPSQKSKKKINQQTHVSNQNNKLGEKPRSPSQSRSKSQHQAQPRSPSQSRSRSQHQAQPRSQSRSLSKSVRLQDKKESSTEIVNKLSNIFEDLSKVLYSINEKRNLGEVVESSGKKKQKIETV